MKKKNPESKEKELPMGEQKQRESCKTVRGNEKKAWKL